jgi:hypothetical protein
LCPSATFLVTLATCAFIVFVSTVRAVRCRFTPRYRKCPRPATRVMRMKRTQKATGECRVSFGCNVYLSNCI